MRMWHDIGAYSAIPKPEAHRHSLTLKRLFDMVLASVLMLVFLPVIGVLTVLVRRDGGPSFFGHMRVGQNGKAFRCWKIRTMVPDAEKVLETYLAENPAAQAEWDRDFKLTDDPRITSLGRFLRATSLDELPQIVNVLAGEMSLVGPRPVTRDELKMYGKFEWCYHALKPGLTGPWQVSGRNDVDYSERVKLDATYYLERSTIGDLVILVRTVGVVFRATGR
ncbi:MAG: sugar transferase [Paracoccaceae bacterium]